MSMDSRRTGSSRRPGRRYLRTVPLAGALAFAAALTAVPAGASTHASARQPSDRVGRTPRAVGARRVGALAPSAHLQVDISLLPRDPAALSEFATAVSTPGNALYRHFIGLKAFVARFGPTAAAISAVESVLRADGLRPGAITANHLIIPVSATASAFGTAFKTGFDLYRMPAGRTAYANAAPPYLGAAARYVEGVIGLNNLYLPHRLGIVAATRSHVARPKAAVSPCSAASSAGSTYSAYTSNEIDSAYNFTGLDNAGDTGAGTTVAIFELEPNIHSDITAFESCYGISTAVELHRRGRWSDRHRTGIRPGGRRDRARHREHHRRRAGRDRRRVPGAELQHRTDRQLHRDRRELGGQGRLDLLGRVRVGVRQLAHLGGEARSSSRARRAGQSIFAAAGDDGSNDCDSTSGQLAVDDPASQPYVTGVGGTTSTSTSRAPTRRCGTTAGRTARAVAGSRRRMRCPRTSPARPAR